MNDDLYWLWFSLRWGEKYTAAEKLLARYGSPAEIFNASCADLGIDDEPDFHSLDEARNIADYCGRRGISIIPLASEYYPAPLKKIKDRPILIYSRGIMPDFSRRLCVAMVGTRKMTSYGERTAYAISYDLARSGVIIVSGMASGIDSVSHRAALDAGGTTVAVLGCGVERAYPAENRRLMDEIMERGAVISEYKPMSQPAGYHFPQRNRIISGTSRGVMVVEADSRSGAMITARDAAYQGRDLFAIPGQVGEFSSNGTNLLIKEGARAVTCAEDVISIYENEYFAVLNLDYLSQPNRDKPVFGGVPDDSSISSSRVSKSRKQQSNDSSRPPRADAQSNRPEPEAAADIQPDEPVEAEIDRPNRSSASANKIVHVNSPSKPTRVFIASELTAEKTKTASDEKSITAGLTEEQSEVFKHIPEQGDISIDELAVLSGLPVKKTLSAFTILEINGVCERVPGGRVKRK